MDLHDYSVDTFEPIGSGDFMMTFGSLEVTALTNRKKKKLTPPASKH